MHLLADFPRRGWDRTLSTRERAEVFPTETGARVAIAKMPQTFKEAGLIFSIESDQ